MRDNRRVPDSRSARRQVADEGGQVAVRPRGVRPAEAVAELLQRQPPLSDGIAQSLDALLALRIAREDRRGLRPLVHTTKLALARHARPPLDSPPRRSSSVG